MGFAAPRKRQPQGFLGAGLADRAGDADELRRRARPRRLAKLAQGEENVRDDQERCRGGEFRPPVGRYHCERGAGRERRGHEIMAVAVVARDGEKRFARRDAAAVDGDSGHAVWQRPEALGAHRLRHRIEGPERLVERPTVAHATPFPASAATTASWSLNGNTCLPTIWPVSWPLPAISSTSPRASPAIAARIASPRSPISRAPGAAARISARIAAASSLRGLSSVMTTASAFSAAIRPIIGRLPGSRSPPAPNTTMRRPET